MDDGDDTISSTGPDQRDAWNGPEGANWAEFSAGRPTDGDLVAHLLAAAGVEPHDRVLDIGCGTGDLTRRAARAAADGSALGVDLSELMVALARREAAAEHLGNASFETGDVQVHPFPADSFDVALSHFGVMFFTEPTAAFANVASAIRPEGRLLFVCPATMERCDWYNVPLAALYGHRPTAEEAPSVMFSLSEPSVLRRALSDAGFERIRVEPADTAFWLGADSEGAARALLGSGPVQAYLDRNPDTTTDPVLAALTDAVAPYHGPDGVRLPGAHWLVEARLPRVAGRRRSGA